MAGASALFWFLYAFSENIVAYYPKAFNLAIAVGQLGNPQVVTDEGWYYAGLLWYPNDHVVVTLLAGPVFFSVLLSALFGLSASLLARSLSVRRASPTLGATGFLGVVPALFSSSAPCCALPAGSLFISAIAPSAALSTFTFTYGPLTSLAVACLMVASIFYLSGPLARLECAVPATKNA